MNPFAPVPGRNQMKRTLLVFALIGFDVKFAAEAKPEPLDEKVPAILAAKQQKYGTPGMVATVIRDGKIVNTYASGYADRENQSPITADTLIPAASLTKLVTAVLVVRQAEQGRLELNKAANDYLPAPMQIAGNDGKPSRATLAQLLTHTSGLPVSWKPIASEGDPVQTLEEYLSQNLKAKFAPGERIVYANDAFSLAGYLAGRAEGERFAEHATRVLLQPLRMHASTFVSPWELKTEKLSRAYGSLMSPGALSVHNDVTAALPAGGLITTAPELARFALMLLNGGELDGALILKKESVESLFKIQARPYPESLTGFGLGFGVNETPGRVIAWWDGGLAGVANRMILHPASRSGVVLLSNQSDNAASSEAANAIFELMVPPAPAAAYTPSADELLRFSGKYRFYDLIDPRLWFLRYFIDLTIEPANGTLRYNSRFLRSGELLPLGSGRFRFVDSRLAGLEVLFDGNTVYMLELTARRIPFLSSAGMIATYALITLAAFLYLFYRLLRAGFRRIFA